MEIINLSQFVAHLVGFLIVLWVLGKFAWPKVLGFIEERQHKIQTDLQAAEFQREEAARVKEELDKEMRSIEAKARQRIQEAVNEGQRVAADVKAGAQKEATERLVRVTQEVERERAKAAEVLREDIVRLAVGMGEKIIGEKLDKETHQRLIDEYVDEVNVSR